MKIVMIHLNFKKKIRDQTGNNYTHTHTHTHTHKNEIIVPLKYLSIFWRILEMLLINYEVYFILNWYIECCAFPDPLEVQATT